MNIRDAVIIDIDYNDYIRVTERMKMSPSRYKGLANEKNYGETALLYDYLIGRCIETSCHVTCTNATLKYKDPFIECSDDMFSNVTLTKVASVIKSLVCRTLRDRKHGRIEVCMYDISMNIESIPPMHSVIMSNKRLYWNATCPKNSFSFQNMCYKMQIVLDWKILHSISFGKRTIFDFICTERDSDKASKSCIGYLSKNKCNKRIPSFM